MTIGETIIAAVGGVTALCVAAKPILVFAEKVYFSRLKARREHYTITNLQMLSNITAKMEEMEQNKKYPNICRCIIFAGHNCGGRPVLGKPYFVSEIGRAVAKEDEIRTGEYPKVEASRQYINMLIDLHRNRKLVFTTNEEEDGQLKKIYQMEGVEQSLIYYLRMSVENYYYYISIASRSGKFTQEEHNYIDIQINTIQGWVNQMY